MSESRTQLTPEAKKGASCAQPSQHLHLPAAAAAASKRIDDSTLSSFGPAPHSAPHCTAHPSARFISLDLIPFSPSNSIAVVTTLLLFGLCFPSDRYRPLHRRRVSCPTTSLTRVCCSAVPNKLDPSLTSSVPAR